MRDIKKQQVSSSCDSAPRLSREQGASLVEYALMIALIAGVTITAVESIGLSVAWSVYDATVGISGEGENTPIGERAPKPTGPRRGGRTDAS